jgi:histidinol-phosphate aminotransferase
MKKHLKDVVRKYDTIDKSKYDYVLNQSERTIPIPGFQKFLQSINQEDFFFYPNTESLKELICEYHCLQYNQLFLCAGSDVGIKAVFETFTNGGRVITSDPSFPMYKVYSELYQCEYFGIPHEKDYTISMEKILSNITHDTDLIILANPNSPMGEHKSFDEIRILLEQGVPTLIDEAYIEFVDEPGLLEYINEYPNLIITRTFSKAYGAAGCRVGMVFSNKDNIEMISKFRHMYEISNVSMKFCKHLINEVDLVDTYVEEVVEEKEKLISMMKDFDVIDSNCNWIHFNNEIDNADTIRIFDKHKVLVKFCSIPHDDRKNWCRLTIQPNITKQKFIKELL